MAVNVHRLLMLDALKHGVDDDEATCPADTRTEEREGRGGLRGLFNRNQFPLSPLLFSQGAVALNIYSLVLSA